MRVHFFVAAVGLSFLALSAGPVGAARALPSVSTEVSGVRISTELGRSRLKVGQEMDLTLRVERTSEAAPVPVALRVRLGMPDHGHWITDEERIVLDGEDVVHAGRFPMTGKYRLRIWVEFADSQDTTAVDFQVPATQLAPVVFETKPDPPPAPASAVAGSVAPDFALPRLSGGGLVTLADLRGKPVWLSFWASWCGPCRAELPEVAEFQARWADKGVHVLAISVDKDPEMAAAFLDRLGVEIDALIDPIGGAATDFDATRIPLNLLIDADGRIVQREEGFRPDLFADADTWIEGLLR